MTNKEAINELNHGIDFADPYIGEDYSEECKSLAIAALEKQIPRKPVLIETNWAYKRIDCPNCHDVISFQMPNQHPKGVNYCRNCGQALDWSDAE